MLIPIKRYFPPPKRIHSNCFLQFLSKSSNFLLALGFLCDFAYLRNNICVGFPLCGFLGPLLWSPTHTWNMFKKTTSQETQTNQIGSSENKEQFFTMSTLFFKGGGVCILFQINLSGAMRFAIRATTKHVKTIHIKRLSTNLQHHKGTQWQLN